MDEDQLQLTFWREKKLFFSLPETFYTKNTVTLIFMYVCIFNRYQPFHSLLLSTHWSDLAFFSMLRGRTNRCILPPPISICHCLSVVPCPAMPAASHTCCFRSLRETYPRFLFCSSILFHFLISHSLTAFRCRFCHSSFFSSLRKKK